MNDKNTITAIVLSALVLLGWQYFVGMPQMEKQRQEALLKQQQQQQAPAPSTTPPPSTVPPPRTAPPPRADHGARPRRAPRPRPGGAAGRPARARPGEPRRASADPRGGACRLPAHLNRHPAAERLDRAQSLAARRPRADAIPRDRRPEIAADRAALAVRHRTPVLYRVRLGARRGHGRKAPRRRRRLGAGRA